MPVLSGMPSILGHYAPPGTRHGAKGRDPVADEADRLYPYPADFSDEDLLATVTRIVNEALQAEGLDPSALAGGVRLQPGADFAGAFFPGTNEIAINPKGMRRNLRELQRVGEHEVAHALEFLQGRGRISGAPEGYEGFAPPSWDPEGTTLEQGQFHYPQWRGTQADLFGRRGGASLRDIYEDPEVEIGREGGFGREGWSRPLGWLMGKPPAKPGRKGKLLSVYPEAQEELGPYFETPGIGTFTGTIRPDYTPPPIVRAGAGPAAPAAPARSPGLVGRAVPRSI